jgi:predicted lipase
VSNIFDLTAERFSRATALSLSQFSQLVYKDEADVKAVLNEGGLHVSWIDDGDTQAFIASDDEVIVVCFRGTDDPKAAIVDAKIRRVPYVGVRGLREGVGTVHRGFYDAFTEIESELIDTVYDDHGGQDHDKPILVTGHSLGGALAVLGADQLAVGPRKVRLYTFGQPRVFNGPQALDCAGRLLGYHRFIHNNDVVTRVPPGWCTRYRHAGRVNHFTHTGRHLVDPESWMAFADRVMGRWNSRKLNPLKWTSDGLDDHSMKHYVRLISAWEEAPRLDG